MHFLTVVLMKRYPGRYPYLDMNVMPLSTCEMTQICELSNDKDTTEQVERQVIIDQQDELLSTAVHPIDKP